MPSEHALLGPSSAAMWARCPGALLMGKGKPRKATEDTASGTLTHAIGEHILRGEGRHNPTEWFYEVGSEHTVDDFKFTVDQDRLDRAQRYASAVLREPGQKFVEHRLSTSPILGVPDQFGTADCISVDPQSAVLIDNVEHRGVITVHDFKDGIGNIVWAKNNLQGLIYGSAALYEFDMLAPFNAVRFCIHQPRANHYDEWTYSRTEVEHFISVIRPAAKLAYDLYHGNTDFVPAQHLNPGHEQCMWCPARGGCPARAKRIVDTFGVLAVKHEIDDAQLSDIYVKLDELESAIKDFRAEAYARARAGRKITGYKLVLGNKGRRFWKDKAAAESLLAMTIDDDKLYEPREIVSPTEVERIVGKKAYAKMGALKALVDQAPGSPTLVPENDKRTEIAKTEFEVLADA